MSVEQETRVAIFFYLTINIRKLRGLDAWLVLNSVQTAKRWVSSFYIIVASQNLH